MNRPALITLLFGLFVGIMIGVSVAGSKYTQDIGAATRVGQLVYDDAAYIILPVAPPVISGMGSM